MRCKKNITYNVGNITLNLENIISFYRNLIGHLTDKQKILTLRFKNITPSFKNITLCSLILTLSSINIINTFTYISNVSALDYSGNVGIGFTFNPTLSVNISPSDLIIPNLAPGTTSDSNSINVSVATNAAYGYTLSATVGNSLHNNTNLTHANNTNTFNSITTDASLSNPTTDNTWGYSYRLSNNSNSNAWSNYSGLSNETSKTLVNTDNRAAKPIDFKIAAKASNIQASGTYTNTINFIAISKPIPKTIEDIAYMQTFGELVEPDLQSVKDSMEEEHTYILKDARDEQDYTVAKLKDGKIWMTKNLNLAGGTVITSELSDVPANYTLPTANGFQEGNRLPASSQTGFNNAAIAHVYNTGNNTNNCASPGCYSYYSWTATTAGSGVGITANTDAPYSICPRGWRLPSDIDESDFYLLVTAYNMNPNMLIGVSTTPNFVFAGFYYSNSFYGGRNVNYTSSTSYSGDTAGNINIDSSRVNISTLSRKYGICARCIAR